MSNNSPIQQWKRIHEALLEKERHLTQLLVRYARGNVEAAVVEHVKMEVDILHKLADAMFQEAFGARDG